MIATYIYKLDYCSRGGVLLLLCCYCIKTTTLSLFVTLQGTRYLREAFLHIIYGSDNIVPTRCLTIRDPNDGISSISFQCGYTLRGRLLLVPWSVILLRQIKVVCHEVDLDLSLLACEMDEEITIDILGLVSASPEVKGMQGVRVECALRKQGDVSR